MARIIKNSRARTNVPIMASTGRSGISPRRDMSTHRTGGSGPTYRSNKSDNRESVRGNQLNVDSDRDIDKMTTGRRPLAIDEVSGSGFGASASESSELNFSADSDESRFLEYEVEPFKQQHVACFCKEDGTTCLKHNAAFPRLVEIVRLTTQQVT